MKALQSFECHQHEQYETISMQKLATVLGGGIYSSFQPHLASEGTA